LQLNKEKVDKDDCMKDMEELIESSEFMTEELKTLREEDISKTEAI
jgi:hypothetical protein